MPKVIFLSTVLLIVLSVIAASKSNTTNYGEFDLHVRTFEPCKGPKLKDCAVVTATIVDASKVHYDMNLTRNMKPTKAKITAASNGKLLARLQATNPCDHLFLRPLFQSMLNVTDSCVILKGYYSFQIDIDKIAKTYYHGTFLYGNITFKSAFFNEQCNLSCTVVNVTFAPKEL